MSEAIETSSIPFPDFVARHRNSSPDELRTKEAPGYLLVTRVKAGEGDTSSLKTLLGSGIRTPLRKTLKDMVVFPIRKTNTDTSENLITVGRVGKCDLVLPHGSMSRFHAYFRYDPERRSFTLSDAGSLNGTKINQKPLEKNRPQRLNPGDAVTFGKAFGATFHTPESMLEYISNFKDYVT